MAVVDLLTLQERRTRGDMITTFKSLSQFENADLKQFFEMGNINNLKHTKWNRKDVEKYFYCNKVVDEWYKKQ